MKTKLRKLLALLMTLAMFISSVPTTALAAVVPYSGGTDTGSGISLRSIVKPPVATTTYVFMNGTEEFARQILKNGETLNNPGTPDAGSANKEFTGWRDGDNNAPTFGAVTVTETKTITYHAQFADVYFVFFTNPNGEVMVTKKGANGETISTEGVTYPVGNEESITAWLDANGSPVSSVTLNGSDVTLTARVENGHWITYDSQGGTYVAPAFVKGNGTTTAPAAPTRPGYTFRHWSATVGGAAFTFGQPLDQALTLYAVWTANTNTRYTVIHWLENADDNEYSYRESETRTGATGAQTSAAAKSYTGFTAQDITQQTIAGDGSTIVSVYYKRNVYNVRFYNRRGTREYTQYKITAKYGANIRDKWPTGTFWYVSQGSGNTAQSNLDTMPIGGKNFYGEASGSGKADYYVEVLPGESGTETVGGKTYKLDHTDTGYTSGTVTDEERYEMTGFTCNVQYSAKNGAEYNGSKFYYDRNSYNIVYVSGGKPVDTASKKFEQSIADAGSYTPPVKPVGQEDYVFGGWYADEATTEPYDFTGKTMPAQNVTVYAKWNKPVYNGTIYLTIEGTTGSSFTLSVPKGDTIETALNEKQAEIMAQVGEGYTWRGRRTGKDGTGEPFNPQTQITTDVTLYPYYTKDGTFKVEYDAVKNDVTAPEDGKSYAEDSFADLMSPGKLVADDGEYFLGWSDGAVTYQPRDKYQIKSNHANERNVITLTAQWGARPAGTTLTYKANGGAGADVVKNLANNETVTTIANPFSRVGYTFKGWDTAPKGEGSIAPNTQVQVDNNGGENVLYAIWTANTDTKYTVEFYYQNVDGTYTLNHSDERTATTDTEVSVTDADKAAKENNKYVFEADNKNNVLSGVVAGDGSLVLKLYFKLNTASYTIHHYLNGTTVKVADDQTGTKTIGETLTAKKSDALYAAYAAAVVAVYAPSQTIKIAADESENVITVYYTMPLTITAGNAEKTYDGQPLTQPDFTVEGLVNGDTKENFTLSMTAASTITNAGSTPNVIDQDTVKYNGGAIPSYYNVSYTNGTLTVNKAPATVTITGVNETAVYDGKQHEANGYNYSFTGKPNEITISLKPNVLAIARRTDVGTTYMGLTKDSFTVTSANYDVTINEVIDGYVTITPVTDKVTVTVTENGAIVTYDGNEHSVKGYKSMTADNKLYDVTKSVKATETAAWTAKGTNAGEYPVGVAAGDFENTNKNFTNVAFVIVDGVLKINPVADEVIVTVTENGATVTYDGNEHSVKGYKSMTADNELYDVATSVKATETAAWTAKGTNAGEYPVGIAAGDFENTNKNFTNVAFKIVDGVLKINPITENTITITANSASKTYDGTPLTDNGFTFTQGVLADGDELTAVVEGSATNVGDEGRNVVKSYVVKRGETDVTKNYTFGNSIDGKLTINKRTVTLTSETASKEYDGTPLTKPVVAVTGDGFVEGEVTDVKATGSVTFVHEGEVTNAITFTTGEKFNEKNYTITKNEGKLSITKREGEGKTITVTAKSDEKVYDGAPLTNNGFTHAGALVEGDVLTAVVEGSQTDVGSSDNVVTSYRVMRGETDVTTSYTFTESGKGALTVTARAVTFTGESKSLPYTGGMQSITGITQSGLVEGHKYEGLTYKAEGQNVGSYDGAFSGDVVIKDAQGNDVTKNYNVTKTPGKLTITNASFIVTFTGESDTKVYNGSEQSITGITVAGLKTGHRYENLTYAAKGTDKGEYVGAFTGTVKILDENNVDVTENYAITQTPGKLTITAVETEVVVTITGHKATVTYDGAEHTVTGYDVSISNELYKEADFTFTGTAEVKATDASDTAYAMGLKDTDFANKNGNFSNVKFVVTDGSLTINKRSVTLKSETASKEYDGTPLTKPVVTVGGDGFVAGEVTDVKATGSVTFVHEGEVTNAITFTEGANFKETNYTISKNEGKLSITKREGEGKTITVTAKSDEKVYDGAPLTNNGFTHAGALVEGDVLTAVVEGSQTDVGSSDNVVTSYRVMRGETDVTTSYTFTESGKGALTVTARAVTFTGESKSLPYTGGMQSITGITQSGLVEGHKYEGLTYKAEGQNVGSYDGAFSGDVVIKDAQGNDVTKNYNVTKTPGKLTITNASFIVTFTGESDTKVYNGSEQSITGITVAGLKTGHRYENLTYAAKGTDKGEYVGAFTGTVKILDENNVDVTENYAITTTPGKLTITAVETEVIVTIRGTKDTVEYDGQKHEVNGYEVVSISNTLYTEADFGFADGARAHAEGTDAGDYFMNLTKDSFVNRNGNFSAVTFVVEDGQLTITKRGLDEKKLVKITAADNSVYYDGQPHGAKLNAAGQIEVGTSYTTEYLAPGHKVQAVAIDGSETMVGVYEDRLVPKTAIIVDENDNDVTRNYVITYVPGTLEIRKNETEIKVTANSHTWEYDGQPHSDGGYTVNYDGVDYPVAAGEFATLPTGDKVTATVEGTVTNVADSADDNNVVTNVTITNEAGVVVNDQYKTITRVNGGLKITRRGDSEDEDKKVKIIAEPNTVGYDGKAHGAKLNAKGEIELGTSYTTARLVDGHYVDETTLDITGSQTNVGVYEEELKPAVKAGATRIVIRDKDGNDVTDNYALTLVNATLTITGDKLIPDKKAEDENIESNYKLGDKIEFTITVKNVSIYDVENVIVTDASAEIQAGDGYTVSADKHTATIAIIAAKSEIRIKALHTVTSEDILAGKVGNVANVEWKDGETTVTKTVDDDTTKLTPPNVTLNVTKTSDWEGKATGAKLELGTKITYTITVKNTGNVPYTNVNFTDLLQNGDATVTGEIPTYGTLAVNEEKSFTVEYIVTEADLLKESINNKVTAEADEIEYTYYEGETEKTGKATPKGDAQVTDNTDAASASFTSTKTTTSTPKNEKGYALGEKITYEIKVTNDGNLTVTGIEVVDNLEGAEIKAGSGYDVVNGKAVIAELKPGESVTVKVEYVVTEADILAGKVVNDATVTGKGPGTDPEPDEPKTDDPTDEPKATLEIVKAVEGNPENGTSYALGEKITYTLTVKVGADNNVTVKDVRVTDTLLTAENVNAKIVEIAGGYTLNATGEIELPDMAPGAADVVITYTYTVQESDLGSGAYGSVHNAAVSKGATPDPDPENPNPKPVDPKDEDDNDTPTNIRLIITAKDNLGIEYDGDAHGENGYDATGLATGHEITSVTISGSRTNVGYYTDELEPSDAVIKEGNEDVTSHYEITYVPGDLEIIRRGDSEDEDRKVRIIAEPNTVGYDGKAHGAKLNAKGEIELGTSYTTARLVDGHYVDETTLDITGSQTNVGVYEEELKPAVKAGATRIVIRDKDGNDVTDNYALTLVNATLTITGDKLIPDKKAEDENIESNYKLGDKIEFTITVKNVSIYDVENVIVTDASAEIQAGDGYTVSADKHTATIAIIAAKSEIRIKALHTVTSEDILAGKVGNVANVEWKDGETTVTKTVDDDTTKLTPPNVTLNVTKTSDWEGKATGAKLELGTKITYTITVKNTGNVPYTNVNFTDLLQNGDATVTGEIPTYGTLAVNEEKSFTVEYIVTEADLLKESINNKVTAEADEIEYTYYEGETEKTGKATPKGDAQVTDNTDAASASFTSTKTTTSTPKNEKGYALGEKITYEIKVTNDGNLTVTGIEVVDNLEGAEIKAGSGYDVVNGKAVIAELKPGESVTVKVEYVVTEADILAGKVVNDATVTGKGPGTDPEPDEPKTDDPTDEPKATLEIVKAVEGNPENGTSYALGEKITYTLTVKVGADNNVTVKDVRVTDTLLTAENVNAKIVEIAGGYTLNATGEIELPDMAPGAADVVITYTYTVQESDLGSGAYGSVHNAAVSKGATPDPDPENPNPKPDDPKDEDKKDTPTNIRLVITANNNTGIVYDGEEHGEDGYKQTGLSKDHTIEKVTISGKRTNVGEEKLVPSDAKIVDKAGNDVTSHYDIEYVNATLEIIQKKLTITADSDEKFYDETPLTKDSYTNTELAKGDKIANVTITGTITEVGSVENVASGAKIVNAAGEDVTGNYDIEYVKGTLTIKAIPADGFVDVTITKKWDDANNQDGKRDDVTLTLNASANGRLIDWDVLKDIAKNGANLTMDETAEHVFARAEFTDDKDSYSYTFRNVPKYANFNDVNTLIDFAVTENEVPDFYEIDVESSTRLMIVNVHEVKTMNIHVTKVWDDEDNNDGYRPDAITVKLYADGALYGEKTITPDENDVWETTFENLPVYKKGETISYTVEEDAIDEYTTTYSTEKPIVGGDYDEAPHEVTITNRYEIKKMNIKVIKIWADAGNTDKLRPSELTFNLYKTVGDGEKELVQEFRLKSSNGNSVWKHKDLRTTLEGLNVYENGEKVHYSIEETTKLEGYTVKYIDNDIVGGNKVNDQYQTDFMTWVTNYHIIKRPNRLIGPMGMTSGECVE